MVDIGTPVGLAGSGVEGLEGAPAFLKADVDGASLMGVPTLGVFEEKGDCVGSSITIAPPEELFSVGAPEMLDRRSGWPRRASACAGSYQTPQCSQMVCQPKRNTITTHRPFGSDHPTSGKNLAILSDGSHCVGSIIVSDPEAIKYFCIGFWLR